MTTFKDHFSNHAADYASYRPGYPPALAAWLGELAPTRKLALDCGCGTGQFSCLLGDVFERVIATDASVEQIAQAAPHPDVTYRIASAEDSGLPDGSADLVTVAQAAHWFDLPAFYQEVRRVLRPAGVLALISYGLARVSPEIDAVVQRFYDGAAAAYWPPERHHVEDGYARLDFPFLEIAAPEFRMEATWSFQTYSGYLGTWSAVKHLEQDQGPTPFRSFLDELEQAWGGPSVIRRITWPLSLRVGQL